MTNKAETDLFPQMPQSTKDALGCSLLRAVQRWKGAPEERIREEEDRAREAERILMARKINRLENEK